MFLLDANVFIEAKNRYYAFDIAPGFWDWLEKAHSSSIACSLDAVRKELLVKEDEVSKWVKDNPSFFRPLDKGTTRHFQELTSWATSNGFNQSAIQQFTSNDADYLLVAYAREHQHTVVSHEVSHPTRRRKIFIPDACRAMGVESVDTFDMLRKTGAQLDLRSKDRLF